MFFYQERVHGQIGIDGVSNACHFGHLLHDHCIVYSVSRIFSPCKRSVIFAKYGRNGNRIKISCVKLAYDKLSCVFFICILNLLFCKAAYTWNLTVNIISMSGSIAWNCAAGLCPAGSPRGMSMYDSTDLFVFFIKFNMRCRVR
mgnify:CR=1 FL=1